METTLYIKNMVCPRCKMAVDQVLRDMQLHPKSVDLGEVHIEEELSEETLIDLQKRLESIGFELLNDKKKQTINHIKSAIIQLVHYKYNNSTLNLSDFVARECHSDYSALSKLFSEVVGITIERYYIEQRVERVKELIEYDELSLTEIALLLKYSSVAYLSTQFKSVTGMTPSQFKALKVNKRIDLDKIGE